METILIFVLKTLIAVFGFSILVFFHELGHFLIAILFKIKVEKFSIGMGPAIWGFKKGETFFQIGTIPFGGFCQFKGDEIKDDLPIEINFENFNNILNKIKDKESKDFILKYYQVDLPDELDKVNYDNIKKAVLKEQINLLEKCFSFNDIDDNYKIKDLNPDEKSDLIKMLKKSGYSLKYKLSNNPDFIIKKSLTTPPLGRSGLHGNSGIGRVPHRRTSPYLSFTVFLRCYCWEVTPINTPSPLVF